MEHNFRKRLLEGELLIGSVVTITSPVVAEILAEAGCDWIFIDEEHAPIGPQEIQTILQAAAPKCAGVVRISSSEELPIKKALDAGAAGIIVPQVNTADQARSVISYGKYEPMGNRGVGLTRAHRYGLGFQRYLEKANEETAVILQAESAQAVRNIDAITDVEGVDAILVGPFDLSASLGKTGKLDDPEVQEAIDKVVEVCRKKKMRLGIFGISVEAVKPYVERGFTLIAAGVDSNFVALGARKILSGLGRQDL